MSELHILLKVRLKVHPVLQTMLIDILQYKHKWVVEGASIVPKELEFRSSAMGKWEDELDELGELVDLDAMHYTKSALGKVSFPPKVCFVPGKMVHVQFDSRS